MRFEVEVFGVVLRVTLGPEEQGDWEYAHDRLHADVVHAGEQEDPVFPRLDWGDDEEGRANTHGVGHERGRVPGASPDRRPGFGFDMQG